MIFASTMLYTASKKLGLEKAQGEFFRQVQGLAQAGAANIVDVDDVEWWGFPAALTIARVALCGELKLHVNAGATVIGKGRSIAAHAFLSEPEARVWVSVDDDVVVSADALAAMVEKCLSEPCVVVAPCLERGSDAVNIVSRNVLVDTRHMQVIDSGGFGCVAFSRKVIELARDIAGNSEDWWQDGVSMRAIFRDLVDGGEWYTEDKAFFRRFAVCGDSLEAYAVRRGFTTHAGQKLDLATLKPVPLRAEPPRNYSRLKQ